METKFKRMRVKPETSWIKRAEWELENEELSDFYSKMALKWIHEMKENKKTEEEMANMLDITPRDFHLIIHGMNTQKIEDKYHFYANRETK